MSSNTRLEVREVTGRRGLTEFIRVPWGIYQRDPNWVPPLLIERKSVLSKHSPFSEHADWNAWTAFKNGKPVGRISAQIDHLHQQRYDNKTGFFGLIEAVEDESVFNALFNTAEAWLQQRGMRQVLGPFSLNINQEIGVLVDGFDTQPFIMMGHAPDYYGEAIEACGYRPAQDLLAYGLSARTLMLPRTMQALIKRNANRVTVRPLRSGENKTELEVMRDIFNDAWQDNWNFVPFTHSEFRAVGKKLLMLLPPDFIQIAELDGEAVAFVVLLPNLNEAIADLNGRLFPFGWAKLAWRLKKNLPRTARVPLMGVRKRYQNTLFGPALAYLVINAVMEAGLKHSVKNVELSWVLEHNRATRNIIESLGGEVTKRYRMYEKDL